MRLFEPDLSEISWEDFDSILNRIKSGQLPRESSFLELKKELDEFEKWKEPKSGKRSISKLAKGKIFKEICAFANSDGGTLIIGLDEADLTVNSIPDPEDLADRIDSMCQTILEPPIREVYARGLTSSLQESIVIVEIPASNKAPHRLMSSEITSEFKGQVYVRSNTKSTPVTMSHVHDIVRARDMGEIHFTRKLDEFKSQKMKLKDRKDRRFIFGIKAFPRREYSAKIPQFPPTIAGKILANLIDIPNSYAGLIDAKNDLTRNYRVLRGRQWRYIDRLIGHTVTMEFRENGEFELILTGGNKSGSNSELRLRHIIGASFWAATLLKRLSSNSEYTVVPYISACFPKITHETGVSSKLELSELLKGQPDWAKDEILPDLVFRFGDNELSWANQLLSDFFDVLSIEHPKTIIQRFAEQPEFWEEFNVT